MTRLLALAMICGSLLSHADVLQNRPFTLLLGPGGTGTIRLAQLKIVKVEVADPKVCEAYPGSDGTVHVVAKSVGTTPVTLFGADGRKQPYRVIVQAPKRY